MELQRGNVAERPFARLVYNIARERFTGDLVLAADQIYRTSWEGGRVVAAASAAPSDSLARVALSAGLASSTALGQFLDELRRNPKADEIEVMTRIARLGPEQILLLKQRLLAQRALRQFALAEAEFTVNNARSMSADPHVPPLDPRWMIFHGVKTHYRAERLEREMSPVFGKRFNVAADAGVNIGSFGFSAPEMEAVRRLGQPLSVDELIAQTGELDRTTVLAIVYALVATDCLEPAGNAPRTGTTANPLTEPAAKRITRAELDAVRRDRVSTAPPQPQPAAATQPTPIERRRRRSTAAAAFSRRHEVTTGVNLRAPTKIRPSEVTALVSSKGRLVDENADHFRLLGIAFNAGDREIRKAYFDLAKRLHPDRLQALELHELMGEAQRVFAAINSAFATLSDRRTLNEYRRSLESTVGQIGSGDEVDAEAIAAAIFAAEDAFRLGQMALRRNHLPEAVESFAKAVELNPDDGEHHAFLAWAVFCAAPEKGRVMTKVNDGFAKAIEISPNNPTTHLLRGHFARQTGDSARAERYYRKVLTLDPQSTEAQMNLRLLGRG